MSNWYLYIMFKDNYLQCSFRVCTSFISEHKCLCVLYFKDNTFRPEDANLCCVKSLRIKLALLFLRWVWSWNRCTAAEFHCCLVMHREFNVEKYTNLAFFYLHLMMCSNCTREFSTLISAHEERMFKNTKGFIVFLYHVPASTRA